jgi:NADH:ubiquinone oxidoreductase subunit 4 (subunit M)
LSEELNIFIIIGLLIKFTVYFLHYWLPKVHVESPTTGSVLLAGYLLKFGTHGFSRLSGSLVYINLFWFFFISYLGIIVCSLVCMFQRDVKSIIAYSSVVHIRFLLITMLMFSGFRKNSGLIIILRHGYTSVVLFFLVGEVVHYLQVRIVYYFNSVFVSNYLLRIVLSFFFFIK